MTHPNVRARTLREAGDVLRAMVYAPDPDVAAWVESELERGRVRWQLARSVEQVVAGLTEDPPPRAQLLIADVDRMSPVDVLQIHGIREQGWFGLVIGLGDVPSSLQASLGIDRVIAPPYTEHALAREVAEVGITKPTTRIAVLPRP